MVSKHLLKLTLLAFPLFVPAHAETTASGVEITFLANTDSSDTLPELQLSLQNDETASEESPDGSEMPGASDDDSDLWQRIKSGYAMPELNSPFTAKHESWYATRPDYMQRMVGRSQKYLYHIVEEVQKRGMPTEIALLPMVESAFNPKAYSTSKASGIWQFVPATGKHFGLKQNWWVDNRRNVTAATNAALNYLQKLHVMFGTWDLALAAYNAGEGTVMRAIERNRKKGLPTDYQSLDLPPETKNYVPKLQAMKNIVTNPGRYGLDIQPIANQPYFTKVNAPQQMDIKLAAKLAGVSMDEFVSLNPEYNRPVMAAADGQSEILLPVEAAEAFASNLASYDKPLLSWQTYSAKRGERLENIARKFGTSPTQLREANDINGKGKLKASRTLLVPLQDESDAPELASSEEIASEDKRNDAAPATIRHSVRNGETLGAIAKRYGVSTRQLMALNHLKSAKRIKKGQVLLVRQDGGTRVAAAERSDKPGRTQYVVRRGDTLHSIARKFDIATDDLMRWNNLSGSRIAPGHRLKILRADAA